MSQNIRVSVIQTLISGINVNWISICGSCNITRHYHLIQNVVKERNAFTRICQTTQLQVL